MEKKVPNKLFICLLKNRSDEVGWEEIRASVSEEHGRYMTDLWQKGIFWAGGPTPRNISIEIYAVDSIEEAMEAQRNAPHYRTGFLYDDQYLEWSLRHWPPLRPNIDPDSGRICDH